MNLQMTMSPGSSFTVNGKSMDASSLSSINAPGSGVHVGGTVLDGSSVTIGGNIVGGGGQTTTSSSSGSGTTSTVCDGNGCVTTSTGATYMQSALATLFVTIALVA